LEDILSVVAIGEPLGFEQADHRFALEDFLQDELYYSETQNKLQMLTGGGQAVAFDVQYEPEIAYRGYAKLIQRLIDYMSTGQVIYFFFNDGTDAEQFLYDIRHEGIEGIQVLGRFAAAIKGVVEIYDEPRDGR
jgi:hypothetical protein